jgi:hypothetical protein
MGNEASFMPSGQQRAAGTDRRAVEREVRARFADEMEHAGLFDRMRIEAKIQKEIRVALDRDSPPGALY